MFNIVSSWNKRRRSKSLDQLNPWVYKTAELWQVKEQSPPPPKKRNCSMVFTLKEMEEATGMFSDKNLIGKGGFGRVYRGLLKDGQIVAIKKMDLPTSKQADGEREFRVEIDVLSRLDHPNLVTLIGYCADGKHRFVVYEFMPRGNLQDILNGKDHHQPKFFLDSTELLPCTLRLIILCNIFRHRRGEDGLGAAVADRARRGEGARLPALEHGRRRPRRPPGLQVQQHPPHRALRGQDFGLAKLMPQDLDLYATTRVLGTFGYFDPEYALTGKLTLQSDVYAFGVVLLELLTGRRAIDLSQGPQDQNLIVKIYQMVGDRKKLRKVVDRDMGKGSYTVESVSMFAGLAARCVCFESAGRPSMQDCVKELQLIMYANMKI